MQARLQIGSDRIVYVGDGGSDIHVMLHVNRRDGFTVAVSENKYIAPIAKRSILSEDALSPLIPVLEEIAGLTDPVSIRSLFESHGLQIQEWDKVQTDWLKINEIAPKSFAHSASQQGSGIDWIGWIATAVFAVSYFCRRPAAMRRAAGPGGCSLDCLWDRHQSPSGHRRQSGGCCSGDYFFVSTPRSAATA